jgi:hypothetical protein
MSSIPPPERDYKHLALLVTVVVETGMMIAVGAYNIYEVRRNSALVQAKIERVSEFSAQQGAKLDRLITGLETFTEAKLEAAKNAAATPLSQEQKMEKAGSLLEALKAKKTKPPIPE